MRTILCFSEEKCEVTEVESIELDDQGRKDRWHLDKLEEALYLITPKRISEVQSTE